MSEVAIEKLSNNKELKVVFVLGGPGSGKGTQCANIVKHFGFTHLSVGDLLRAEVRSGSENGTMIEKMINEGKIVPSEVTIKLLQRAMRESRNDKFLIDGFPRNEENRVAFENIVKIEPEFVLFFDCPEEEMERRILNRNQGRDDDNMETIRKRFKVFIESTLPVIEFYSLKGKIYKIDACKPADEVFEEVKNIFSRFRTKEVSSQETNFSTTLGFELVICLIKRVLTPRCSRIAATGNRMHRWVTKLGRPLLSSSLHCLPPYSSIPLHVRLFSLTRSINSAVNPYVPICPLKLQSPYLPVFPAHVFQSRHFATKKVKRSRAPDTPVVSKVKKYKLKAYSSFKHRFRTMHDGLIRRWRAGKRHNAHLKSKKSKRRLRKPETVHLAYAKVIKKLNFAG